ncbi:MAG: DUF2971 domain-containing protein [Bacteroidia bacterium]
MYKEYSHFHTPEDETIVWRYLDFEKFVDLITIKKLFLCRSDKFADPFEGVLKLKDTNQSEIEINLLTKKFYFVNCWHINDAQSDAMWKIFLKTNNGIAIKSTVKRIKNSLENTQENIHISKINYRDFSRTTFFDLMKEPQNIWPNSNGRGGSVNQYNYKRKSFEHEKELRLIFIDLPIPHAIINGIPREPLEDKIIDIDLTKLIEEVVIAPFADKWFKSLVERLIKQLNLDFKVLESNLYNL